MGLPGGTSPVQIGGARSGPYHSTGGPADSTVEQHGQPDDKAVRLLPPNQVRVLEARTSQTYRFEHALIGGAWHDQVVVSVDRDGSIDRVLTLTESGPAPASNGMMGVEDGSERPAEEGPHRFVRGWAIPGLSNVHSHAFQRGLAGRAERGGTDSFWSWREAMYRFLADLTPDTVEAVAAQLYVELLRGGFTSVGEFHYLHHDVGGKPFSDSGEMSRRIIEAGRRTGINLVHIPVVYHQAGFGGEPLEPGQRRFAMEAEGLAVLTEGLEREVRTGPGSQVTLGWGIHSLRACSEEEMGRAMALFGEHPERPVHIHVAEQTLEVEACVAQRGARPIEWLLEHAPVDPRWCLVHGTWATDQEIAGVCRAEAVVGLCPTTEANLGDGVFPLPQHLASGGRVGVGTDSHVTSRVASELRTLEYGQRLLRTARGIAGPPPNGALSGVGHSLVCRALPGGAQALGLPSGDLSPGLRADVVVLDGEHPSLACHGPETILDAWVFSDHGNPVRDVMVGGRWVVTDGRHRHEDASLARFTQALS